MKTACQFRVSFIWLLLCAVAQGASYPVKISSSNPRILVDQNNVPFMMVGDSPHSLFSNLSSADAATYLADRAARGVNSLWVNLLCVRPVEGRPDGSLLNGTKPFTRTLPATRFYDLTAPNEPYFAHVDEVMRLAATNGIVVMIDPLETAGPLLPTALANGSARCRAYGQYLGNRYRDFHNLIWLNGNDLQQWSVATNDAVVTSVALGIKDKDTNHLQTVELNYQASSSSDDPNWTPIVGLNLAYTYYATYAEVLHAYNQSPNLPVFMGEANFECETNGVGEGAEDGGSPRILRLQEYWAMLSGATGQLYGNRYIWRFLPGWKSQLDSPGVVQLGYLANLFCARKWYELVPDQTHAFVTAGYGSFVSVPPRHAVAQRFAGNDYVTAALTPDGSLGIAYLPQGGTITVAMNKLQKGLTARWFDPSANTFRAIAGSPFSDAGSRQFTSPGKNRAGDPDWILVLETGMLELDLRRLRKLDAGVEQWEQVTNHVRWEPLRTAVVICDMWDRHWCKGATARVAEMAPRMNDVITELRQRGVLIIHCPSGTMKYYEGAPGRKLAQAAPPVETTPPIQSWLALEANREAPLPIDDSDGGCNDNPPCRQASPWTHEIDTLQIGEGDAVTDNAEAFNLMRQRGITNVMVMGVHENMCILGRPFSIRQMVEHGQNVVLLRDLTDTMYNSRSKPWVDHFIGTDLMAWHIEKYWCPTITSDQLIGGSPFRFAANTNALLTFRNYVKLPATDVHYRRVKPYIEDTPNPDYSQASDAARAAFRDMKFGVRIHWGVYAMLGFGCNASWPFVRPDSGHPVLNNEQRQAYQQFYRTFNPTNFNANAWMDLFQTNGIKVVAFTTKHHDGFSMFDTRARVARRVNWTAPGGPKIEACDLAYSIMETPYHRDIVKEVTDAAHRHGLKIDLYFSHPDWYDADFRPFADHPLHDRLDKSAHPRQWDHFIQRHRRQLTELLTQYGKIDLMCLDQYFDQTAWLDLRDTMKTIRRLQPDVMFRCRGIGNYGDYYTPEGFVPGAKENTDMPWMVIYPLAGEGIWSYEPDGAKYKDGAWIVNNLVDAVAKGGNFMVGIGPDATGLFHPKAIAALQYAGAWLKLNGEAIFKTHPLPGDAWKDGRSLRFTHSDLGSITYAIALQWPGNELVLHSLKLPPGATVRMLGNSGSLPWRLDPARGTVITLPARLESLANRLPRSPYVFRLEGE